MYVYTPEKLSAVSAEENEGTTSGRSCKVWVAVITLLVNQ
jgi:hypothetical protein